MISARKYVMYVVVLLGVLAFIMIAAWKQYTQFISTPKSSVATRISVERGDGLRHIVEKLQASGMNTGPLWLWQLLAYQTDALGRIKAGEYALSPAISPHMLLDHMRLGRVIQYKFTIVDGWNIHQLRAALDRAPALRHTIDTMADDALMRALGAEKIDSLEGRFLPETYLYQRDATDLSILKRAYETMSKVLAKVWQSRAPDLPLTNPEQALILASIIEKETALPSERAQISGVFIRRLERNMKLQTDPTVMYGMGSRYQGTLHKQDLTTDTPYNTYTRLGLPPTPIAMPGYPSLVAAVHPAAGDALYFVASGNSQGGHVFSATLEEHNRAVAHYLQQIQQK